MATVNQRPCWVRSHHSHHQLTHPRKNVAIHGDEHAEGESALSRLQKGRAQRPGGEAALVLALWRYRAPSNKFIPPMGSSLQPRRPQRRRRLRLHECEVRRRLRTTSERAAWLQEHAREASLDALLRRIRHQRP